MALPEIKPFYFMGQHSLLFTFKDAGDEVPMRTFNGDQVVIVCAGRVGLVLRGGREEALRSGDGCMVRAGKPHGLKALEPNSVVHKLHADPASITLPEVELSVAP